MRNLVPSLALGGLILFAGAQEMPAQADMSEAGKKALSTAGQVMFDRRCRSCHADDPGKRSYGPSLIGVIGRKAGSLTGYEYSDALKNSGLVWNEALLRAWITDNDGLMPGTRMRHVSITDNSEQDFLLAFLKELSEKE